MRQSQSEAETFDAALRKVLAVPKAEMQRRLEEDRQTRKDHPLEMRLKAVAKRPKRSQIGR